MSMTADPKRNSRVLGIVAICAVAVCVTGAHFTQAAQPTGNAIGINGQTTKHTTNTTTVTNVVNPTTVANNTIPSATALPAATADQTALTASAPSGMTASMDPSLNYSLDYPSDWTTASSSASGIDSFRMTSSDENAMVVVGVASSSYLDTAALQSQLQSNLTAFLTSAGYTLAGTPQYTSATVSGSPAEVGAVAVENSSGITGGVQAAVVYYQGRLYFVVGVLEDGSAANATQETSQIRAVMNSFALR